MTAVIIDGTKLAKRFASELKPRADALTKKLGRPPCLAVLSIGASPAAKSYTANQAKSCKNVGIKTRVKEFPESAAEGETLKTLQALGKDPSIDGILIETPLPVQIRLGKLLEALAPEKDVEGLTPENYGRLFSAKNMDEIRASRIFIPPTARAVIEILEDYGISARGAETVVLGRSSVVGRPAAHLLSCLDATVTLCHSHTGDLSAHLKRADIVVSAIGQPRSIKGNDIKPGAVVIDAGIAYENKKLCGDVDFETAKKTAGLITPVPGGVGPVTTALLLSNVLSAAEK